MKKKIIHKTDREIIRNNYLGDILNDIFLKEGSYLEHADIYDFNDKYVILNQNGFITDISKSFLKEFKLRSNEILKKPIVQFLTLKEVDPEYSEFFLKKLLYFFVYNKYSSGIKIYLNNNAIKVLVKVIPIRVNSSIIYQVFITLINDDKNLSLNNFRKDILNYNYLLNFVPDGVLIHRNGIVVTANNKALELLGYNIGESLVGINLFDFLQSDYISAAKIRLKTLNSGLNVPFYTYKMYGKNRSNLLELEAKSFSLSRFNDDLIFMVLRDKTPNTITQITNEKEFINCLLQDEIIDRVKVQNELQQTQKFLNNVINSSLDIIVATDKDSRISEFNSAAQKVFGYTREEIIGSTISILYASNAVYKKVQNNLKKYGIFSNEILNKKKDGSFFTSFLNLLELKDGLNNSIGSVGVFRDITIVKSQQIALKESERKFRKLFENTSDLLFSFELDGSFVYYNKSFSELLGYKDVELESLGFLQIVHPNSVSNLLSALHNNNTERLNDVEITLIKKTKKFLIINGDIKKIHNSSKVVCSFVCSFKDVSAVRVAEESMKLAEERYKAVFNQNFFGVMICGLFGDVIQYNSKFNSMFHINNSLIGTNVRNIRGEFGDSIYLHASNLLSDSQLKYVGSSFIIIDSVTVAYNESVELVKDIFGNPSFFLFIFEDITARKFAEEELLKQSTKLNSVLQGSSLIIFTVNRHFILTSFNEQFTSYLVNYINIKPFIGLNLLNLRNYFKNGMDFEGLLFVHSNALNGKKQSIENCFINNLSDEVWFESYVDPLLLPGGVIEEISYISSNVTEKKYAYKKLTQSIIEKEILLKEVHHRVKNNLQVISSILNLQTSYLKDTNVIGVVRDIQNRIKSMALIHENLYQNSDISKLNFRDYINQLTQNIIHSNSTNIGNIAFKSNIEDLNLDLDYSIPCGLIINELVSNTFKHAFPDNTDGIVKIDIFEQNKIVNIAVSDTGIGFKDDIDFRNTESLGLQLVTALVEQINGTITLCSTSGLTEYIITFKQKN